MMLLDRGIGKASTSLGGIFEDEEKEHANLDIIELSNIVSVGLTTTPDPTPPGAANYIIPLPRRFSKSHMENSEM